MEQEITIPEPFWSLLRCCKVYCYSTNGRP
ncbi:hypothetical protein O77CONTIG1_04459 [Leptolyngbya sp. O-77]|nr:hypothetical protein O77CONTIG1_04459 [Leptolyngbya sp. O-77]